MEKGARVIFLVDVRYADGEVMVHKGTTAVVLNTTGVQPFPITVRLEKEMADGEDQINVKASEIAEVQDGRGKAEAT